MIKWIKKLIKKFKDWRAKKIIKQVPQHYKPILLNYAFQQSGLSKEAIRQLMINDRNLSKRIIKKIINLGSRKVAKFLKEEK